MVRKISTQIASKIQNFENFKTSRDKVIPSGLNGMSYSLWDTTLITYFIVGGVEQVDINLHNFLTRTTISRVNEIINILSNDRYNIRVIKGIPYLIEHGDLSNKVQLPADNYYNITL
jgi:hypothetical protein